MADIVVTVKGALVVGRLTKRLLDRLHETTATARLREATEIEQRQWRVRRDQQVEERLTRLEAAASDVVEFEAKLAAMLDDRQFLRVQANVEYEAIREATTERQEMLAQAAAGLSDPNMAINLKARLERIIRSLDPEDIAALRDIARLPDIFMPVIRDERPVSFYALIAAGCLVADAGEWDVKGEMTPLGEKVLAVFETGESEPKAGASDA